MIDPGFENYIACPANFTLSSNPPEPLTQTWYIPTLGTSDYYNACAISTPMYVPENFFGFQQALSGDGYSGIFVFSNSILDYREYIESELVSPLTAGLTYDVGFYVSLSDSSDIYIKELGARLSDVNLGGSFNTNITVVPQVVNNSFLSDKNNWQQVKGYFTAAGGEKFITIGNFSYDAALDLSIFPTIAPDAVSYYYIDSAYVSPCIVFHAGSDGSISLCSNGAIVNLSEYLNGADSMGLWLDPSWNPVSEILDPASSAPGFYHYIGGHGSCADSATFEILIMNGGSAGTDNSINICSTTDLISLLHDNPSPGGTWYQPDGTVFTNPYDPSTDPAGIYTYIVGNGICSDTSHLFVTLDQPFNASFLCDIHEGCSPLTVTFTVSDSANDFKEAFWNFGDGQTSTSTYVTHTYTDTGCFDVSLLITTTGGCSADTEAEDIVCVNETPLADFTFNPSPPSLDDPQIAFTNLCTGADNFFWQFGNLNSSSEKNPFYKFPLAEATYQICLTANSSHGCADTLCRTISFSYGPALLFAPNAFTPNGDGLNDEFVVYGKWLSSLDLRIFDRWGNIVFETTDADKGWDGTNDGRVEGEGVYIFMINAVFLGGQHTLKTGNLTLLR